MRKTSCAQVSGGQHRTLFDRSLGYRVGMRGSWISSGLALAMGLCSGCFKLNPGFVEATEGSGSSGGGSTDSTGAPLDECRHEGLAGPRVSLSFNEGAGATTPWVDDVQGVVRLPIGGGGPGNGWEWVEDGLTVTGSNGNGLLIESDAEVSLGSGEAFTVEGWVSPNAGADGPLVVHGDNFAVSLGRASELSLGFYAGGYSGATPEVWSTAPDPGPDPVHVAVVGDPTTLSLYVNGTRLMEAPSDGGRGWASARLGIASVPNRHWHGTYHRLAVYDRAVDHEELGCIAADGWRVDDAP